MILLNVKYVDVKMNSMAVTNSLNLLMLVVRSIQFFLFLILLIARFREMLVKSDTASNKIKISDSDIFKPESDLNNSKLLFI